MPGRSQRSNNSSAFPSSTRPSRSSRITRRPLRAKAREAERPASPPPSTATSTRPDPLATRPTSCAVGAARTTRRKPQTARDSWKTGQIARKPDTQNDWTDCSESDPGTALLELLSYLGDLLSSRQDAVAAEQRLRSRRYALAIGTPLWLSSFGGGARMARTTTE